MLSRNANSHLKTIIQYSRNPDELAKDLILVSLTYVNSRYGFADLKWICGQIQSQTVRFVLENINHA